MYKLFSLCRWLYAGTLAVMALLFANTAFAVGTDYSAITTAISGEQAGIIGVIIGVAGVLAAVFAVRRGAGIGLSALRGR